MADEHNWDREDFEVLLGRAHRLMDTASFKRIFATVADALGTTPMLDARVLRQLLAGPVEYKSGATATARDAVLADLRQREWQLQTEEAWAAVFEAKSLLGAAG